MASITRNPIKNSLRKKVKQCLESLLPSDRELQSNKITRKIVTSSAFLESKRISIYLSTENEVNTMGILKEMFRLNKEVFVPSYREKKMVMLRVRDWNDVESLPLTKWNIKQPTDDGKREEALQNGGLDLILLPGVAFTKNGARLGHGMGYYDKYLNEMFDRFPGRRKLGSNHDISELIKQNQTLLFGLAFEEQILEEIPTEQWDVPLHAVISPS